MPFYIHNSDSSVNIVIPDGVVDTTSYSLSLIGRNVADYGQYFAENTILQLENFASIAAPTPDNLLIGQQWFDKGDNIMRVWDGTQWKAQTGLTVENTFPDSSGGDGQGGTPTPPTVGSGFFNQEDLKLYIWDGVQYLPAAYGGEFSSQYSNDTTLGTPSRYGTKVRNIFLASTEGPKAVIALVYNNDSDVGSVNQGTTQTQYGRETIICLFSDHKTFNIDNTASSTENEQINYYEELVGIGGICSLNGGRILPGINLRQYGQEGGGEAEVPQATRSRYANGSGAILNLERENIIEDFISDPADPAIQADLIYFNQVITTSESIIPDISGLTIGDSNDPYSAGYFETLVFSNVSPYANSITFDGDYFFQGGNVTIETLVTDSILTTELTTGANTIPGDIIGDWTFSAGSDLTLNGDLLLAPSSILTTRNITTGSNNTPGDITGSWTFTAGSDLSLTGQAFLTVRNITTGSNSTPGDITGDWTFTSGSDITMVGGDLTMDTGDLTMTTGILTTTEITSGSSGTSGDITGDWTFTSGSDITMVGGDLTMDTGTLTTTEITSGSVGTSGELEGQWTLTAGSTLQATYADLAENFKPDSDYEPGTVVKIGGSEEITLCTDGYCTDVFGVISENPAYIMNSGGGIPVALQGRTPVNLTGSVKKGQRLVSSGQPGYAMALKEDKYYDPRTIIGRALEDSDSGTVMAVIGVK